MHETTHAGLVTADSICRRCRAQLRRCTSEERRDMTVKSNTRRTVQIVGAVLIAAPTQTSNSGN